MTQIINAIVAMNYAQIIGANNKLPWHIPEDLAHFKQLTLNKPIIMGRQTFDSIGKVLPNRRNIVLSRSGFYHDNVEVFTSLDEAFDSLVDVPEVCIIGGEQIFTQALQKINSLHVTWVDYPVNNPCAWFPTVNWSQWRVVSNVAILSKCGVKCRFIHYLPHEF